VGTSVSEQFARRTKGSARLAPALGFRCPRRRETPTYPGRSAPLRAVVIGARVNIKLQRPASGSRRGLPRKIHGYKYSRAMLALLVLAVNLDAFLLESHAGKASFRSSLDSLWSNCRLRLDLRHAVAPGKRRRADVLVLSISARQEFSTNLPSPSTREKDRHRQHRLERMRGTPGYADGEPVELSFDLPRQKRAVRGERCYFTVKVPSRPFVAVTPVGHKPLRQKVKTGSGFLRRGTGSSIGNFSPAHAQTDRTRGLRPH